MISFLSVLELAVMYDNDQLGLPLDPCCDHKMTKVVEVVVVDKIDTHTHTMKSCSI